MKTILRRLLAVSAVAIPAAACADAGPAGPAEGRAATEVRVSGDAPAGGSASRAASGSAEGEVRGSVEVRARVYLYADGEGWIEVTRGWAEQRVEASGEDGFKLLASSEVEASSYTRVRVEFERVEGDFEGGLFLGLGGGSVAVSLDGGSDGQVTVERSIQLRADAGTRSRLDIDLNTAAWAASGASAGVISEAAFASAVSIGAS